jgi:23S rRNA (adenine2503-C2)-methyltransferase
VTYYNITNLQNACQNESKCAGCAKHSTCAFDLQMSGIAVSRRALPQARSFASCPAASNLAEKLSNLPPPPSVLASTGNVTSNRIVVTPLLSLSLTDLTARLKDMGEKPYRAKQIWKHVYRRGVSSFDDMSDIAAPLRAQLAQHFSIDYGHVFSDNTSADGTRKFGLTYHNAADVEAVYIPAEDRGTLCFSSQHGCSLQCSFCHTGTSTPSFACIEIYHSY